MNQIVPTIQPVWRDGGARAVRLALVRLVARHRSIGLCRDRPCEGASWGKN